MSPIFEEKATPSPDVPTSSSSSSFSFCPVFVSAFGSVLTFAPLFEAVDSVRLSVAKIQSNVQAMFMDGCNGGGSTERERKRERERERERESHAGRLGDEIREAINRR